MFIIHSWSNSWQDSRWSFRIVQFCWEIKLHAYVDLNKKLIVFNFIYCKMLLNWATNLVRGEPPVQLYWIPIIKRGNWKVFVLLFNTSAPSKLRTWTDVVARSKLKKLDGYSLCDVFFCASQITKFWIRIKRTVR